MCPGKARTGTTKKSFVKIQTSAGGVIYRPSASGPMVALVSVKGGRVWTLPKGKAAGKESLEETALREVSEETGLRGELAGKIGEITYWYYLPEKIRCRKTVHFFLMRYVSGSTEDHDWEVDDAAWFPVKKAIGAVTYKGDREMLEKAKKMLSLQESFSDTA